jgi:multidrug transporter EmrE-like cation transporter
MGRLWTLGLVLLCVFLTASAQIALKLGVSGGALQSLAGSNNSPLFLARALLSPQVIVGLALYAISTVLWLLVLAKTDVSYAYPFVSLGFVLTSLYAYFALHEPMVPARLGGIALITAGVLLVARS